jgi:putative ABC transport system ATP-binding protein
MPQIEIQNIYKTYESEGNEVRALQGITFAVEKGDFFIIKGPSGSGKSTLMHILGLLDTPDKGIYSLEGEDVSSLTPDEQSIIRNQKIGFIFQSFNLMPKTSVLDNVTLPLLYGKKEKEWNIKQRAIEVLEMVGLSHRLKHYSNQLSGGEEQRVAIARALINNPSLILADEPTGNLDSKNALAIMDLLLKFNKEKEVTLLVVTHEDYIADYGQKIINIVDGKIKE